MATILQLRNELRAHLLADGGVSALTTTVLPWGELQLTESEGITSAVIYRLASRADDSTLSGRLKYKSVDFEFYCMAGDSDAAWNLAAAVEAALDFHNGTIGSGSVTAEIRMVDASEDYDSEQRIFGVVQNYAITFR